MIERKLRSQLKNGGINMKRKRRKLAAIMCALTLALSTAVPVSACTPPLKTPSVEIPDITFQPDDALKEAINNAAKNWVEKCILVTPTVEYTSYYSRASKYFSYSYVAVKWSEVENATSYKVRITKADGTWKEYDTTYTAFYSTNYTDDFIADGMDDATVKVKAYGDNDTFSLWSHDAVITRFGY